MGCLKLGIVVVVTFALGITFAFAILAGIPELIVEDEVTSGSNISEDHTCKE